MDHTVPRSPDLEEQRFAPQLSRQARDECTAILLAEIRTSWSWESWRDAHLLLVLLHADAAHRAAQALAITPAMARRLERIACATLLWLVARYRGSAPDELDRFIDAGLMTSLSYVITEGSPPRSDEIVAAAIRVDDVALSESWLAPIPRRPSRARLGMVRTLLGANEPHRTVASLIGGTEDDVSRTLGDARRRRSIA